MRYRSNVNAEALIALAQKELYEAEPEQFKVFLLCLFAGLRRNEVDKLEWNAFHFDEGFIRISATRWFRPKTEDSLGDIDVDSEVLELFRNFHSRAKSAFVVESSVPVRGETAYSNYRCPDVFQGLVAWLRKNGVDTGKPLHTLRKEFGSLVCAKAGIFAASRALRHADIQITSQHYLDRKARVTLGLGSLLRVAGAESEATGDPNV
jgi:integrase